MKNKLLCVDRTSISHLIESKYRNTGCPIEWVISMEQKIYEINLERCKISKTEGGTTKQCS